VTVPASYWVRTSSSVSLASSTARVAACSPACLVANWLRLLARSSAMVSDRAWARALASSSCAAAW